VSLVEGCAGNPGQIESAKEAAPPSIETVPRNRATSELPEDLLLEVFEPDPMLPRERTRREAMFEFLEHPSSVFFARELVRRNDVEGHDFWQAHCVSALCRYESHELWRERSTDAEVVSEKLLASYRRSMALSVLGLYGAPAISSDLTAAMTELPGPEEQALAAVALLNGKPTREQVSAVETFMERIPKEDRFSAWAEDIAAQMNPTGFMASCEKGHHLFDPPRIVESLKWEVIETDPTKLDKHDVEGFLRGWVETGNGEEFAEAIVALVERCRHDASCEFETFVTSQSRPERAAALFLFTRTAEPSELLKLVPELARQDYFLRPMTAALLRRDVTPTRQLIELLDLISWQLGESPARGCFDRRPVFELARRLEFRIETDLPF
jgi:hypothetical protein